MAKAVWVKGRGFVDPAKPCGPCEAARRRLQEQVARGQLVRATKTTITGAAAMAGLIPKERLLDQEGDEE